MVDLRLQTNRAVCTYSFTIKPKRIPTPRRLSPAERESHTGSSKGAPIRLRLVSPLPGSDPVRESPSARIDPPKLLQPSWGRLARAPHMCRLIRVGRRRASQPSWLKL